MNFRGHHNKLIVIIMTISEWQEIFRILNESHVINLFLDWMMVLIKKTKSYTIIHFIQKILEWQKALKHGNNFPHRSFQVLLHKSSLDALKMSISIIASSGMSFGLLTTSNSQKTSEIRIKSLSVYVHQCSENEMLLLPDRDAQRLIDGSYWSSPSSCVHYHHNPLRDDSSNFYLHNSFHYCHNWIPPSYAHSRSNSPRHLLVPSRICTHADKFDVGRDGNRVRWSIAPAVGGWEWWEWWIDGLMDRLMDG